VGSLNYEEAFLRLGIDDLQLGFYGSNSYFGTGAPSAYLSAGLGKDLGERLRVFAQVGWLGTGASGSGYYYDRARRLDARLGTRFDLGWVSAELSVVTTTNSDNWCRAQRKACEPGLVLALRATF
jgi:hypothetical protein